jgi:hypothetical protein
LPNSTLAAVLGAHAVDRVQAHERVELLARARLTGAERHVDVVGTGQVAGGPDEGVVVEDVEDARDGHEHVVLGDRDFLAALLARVRLATLHALVAIAVAVAAATTRATAVLVVIPAVALLAVLALLLALLRLTIVLTVAALLALAGLLVPAGSTRSLVAFLTLAAVTISVFVAATVTVVRARVPRRPSSPRACAQRRRLGRPVGP